MALAILSFMLLTTQVWVRTFEEMDQRASDRFKGEAMRLVLSTLSDTAMSDFANASAFYATSRIVNATEIEGFHAATANDSYNPDTGLVEQTAFDLMMYGNSSPSATMSIEYSPAEKDAYTIAAWQGKIRSAANVMGFNASFGNIENFTFRQDGPWQVLSYFEMPMNISDMENTMHQSKRLIANATFPINGFVDPMVVRNELERRPSIPRDPTLVAQKQIWKHAVYNTSGDVAPLLVDDRASEGYGWFYGPITSDYPGVGILNGSELDKIDQYILVHGYDGNLSTYAGAYGAVILTTSPVVVSTNYIDSSGCNVTEHNQTQCLNCLRSVEVVSGDPGCAVPEYIYANEVDVPMIAASGDWSTNRSKIPRVFREGMPVQNQSFVLLDNEFATPERIRQGYHRIWDTTLLRDMAICGFYVQGVPLSGPSFFQRMLANSYASAPIHNPDLGIESFLVGRWAGGKDDQTFDSHSRLDWEFYPDVQPSSKIKGMPGCKNFAMCSGTNATTEGVGKFRLSHNAAARYGLNGIACQASASSPCD